MARLRATYSWGKEKRKTQLGMKMQTGEERRSRGRVKDSGLISCQKHIKTPATCGVTLAEIDVGTRRAALLQPKKRQIHMESNRKGGKVTWLRHNGGHRRCKDIRGLGILLRE